MNYTNSNLQADVSHIIAKVFGFMTAALAITAGSAYYIAQTPTLLAKIQQPNILLFLFIFQIAMVVAISFFINKLSTPLVITAFILYALSLGFTLSTIFLVYTQTSIYSAFLTAAGMFGIMALYGYFTRSDLSSIGSIGTMLLFGLIIGMFINWFLQSSTFNYIISGIGVILFTLLTAYDMQKIKRTAQQLMYQRETHNKIAVVGALTLYLDFINLFLFILQFMGNRKD